jgi:DedD protein
VRDVLKQRLVGALILIALGVLFWPLVFVDSDRVSLDRTSQVPPMPNLEQMKISTPQPLRNIEPAVTVAEIPLHDQPPQLPESRAADTASSAAVAATPVSRPQPKLDDAGIPVAWVLQVVSVSERSKAEKLTNELIGLGYKAYHRPLKRGQKTLYRVNVGPVFDKQKLRKAKVAIDQHLHVTAIIARYIP